MSLRSRLNAATSQFAHLNRPAAAKAPPAKDKMPTQDGKTTPAEPVDDETKDDMNQPDPSDNNGDDDDDNDGDDENDDDAEADDDDETGDDSADETEMRKSKKGKAKTVRSARMRERARCAAIFTDKAAAANPAMAAELAFTTNLGRKAAVRVLRQAGARGGLRDIMTGANAPRISPDAPNAPGAQTAAERALAVAGQCRPAGNRR